MFPGGRIYSDVSKISIHFQKPRISVFEKIQCEAKDHAESYTLMK